MTKVMGLNGISTTVAPVNTGSLVASKNIGDSPMMRQVRTFKIPRKINNSFEKKALFAWVNKLIQKDLINGRQILGWGFSHLPGHIRMLTEEIYAPTKVYGRSPADLLPRRT